MKGRLYDLRAPDNAVRTVLHYFDYFHYPLTVPEIQQYCRVQITPELLPQLISRLLQSGIIETERGYYGIRDIRAAVSEREAGEKRYRQLQQRIKKSAAVLSRFPFVKFVGLSGSLSKGYAPARADIDLFLVTDTNRLWICRTLLHLYKKLSFLRGNQHWYCMNYFIDETALYLEEQNYYTAIELTTMKPLYDPHNTYQRMIEVNKVWIQEQLPNYSGEPAMPQINVSDKRSHHLLARITGNSWLNQQLMRLTDAKWKHKWRKKQYPAEDYEQAFKTRINISKNHYHNYQKKLLKHLEQLPELLKESRKE